MTAEASYDFLCSLDDALGKDLEAWTREDTGPGRIGFTTPFSIIRSLDPGQVAILGVEANTSAVPDIVDAEQELRFRPKAIRLLPPFLSSLDTPSLGHGDEDGMDAPRMGC
jgi:hypothetical protein